MPNIGAPELIIVLLIALLIFGGAKLPKLARSLREAKDEFEGGKDDAKKDAKSKDADKDAARELPRIAGDDRVTLSKSELEAMLVEREQRAKRD